MQDVKNWMFFFDCKKIIVWKENIFGLIRIAVKLKSLLANKNSIILC